MDAYTYGRLVQHGGYATGGPVVQYITAGFTPDSAMHAVTTGDTTLLRHQGWISIQLRQPGARDDPDDGSAGVPARV